MSETVKPLAVDDVLRLQSEGAQVVDVRDAIDFEGSHLK
jgi:rhodanese-related sulfurtransferase